MKSLWLIMLAVVVEKPFTVDTDEADRLIEIAKNGNKVLAVFQSMHLHPQL